MRLNRALFYSSQNWYSVSDGRASTSPLRHRAWLSFTVRSNTNTLSIQFHSEMWPDKTLQIWVEIPKLVVGVRHCAKHITSWTKALMNDGVVARPAVPPNICFYDFLFDKKKEKIKIFVCMCTCSTEENREMATSPKEIYWQKTEIPLSLLLWKLLNKTYWCHCFLKMVKYL